MTDALCRAGLVRSLGCEIADPDSSAEELGRCVLLLELLVDSNAVSAEQADALLATRDAGPRA